MSYPHDRPAQDPGGMECYECGTIFVGSEAHDQCAVCANNGWFPIDTAPTDSEIMLAWRAVEKPGGDPGWFQTIGRWEAQFESAWDDEKSESGYRGAWTDYTVASWNYEEYCELHPKYWRPLPKPPVQP